VSDEIENEIKNEINIDEDDCTILVKKTLKSSEENIISEDATQLAQGKRRVSAQSKSDAVQHDDELTRISPSSAKTTSSSDLSSNVSNAKELDVSDYSTSDLTSSSTSTSLTDAINRTNLEVRGLKSRNKQLKIINQRFLLASKLGTGGMGAVYRAKDLRKVEAQDKNPWVALKLLNEAFKEHPTAFIALQREAQKSQKLAHPNIVRVYDFDRDGETVYMTMELLKGEDLNHIIKRKKRGLEREDALSIIRQVGGALAEAHKHNIVHSDFKPGNIFYTDDKVAKVFDFGIARAVSEIGTGPFNAAESAGIDNDNTMFDASTLNALTPAYASKEMHDGQDACKSDDVYALGCVAYEVLTGKHPYGKTPSNKVVDHRLKFPIVEGMKRNQLRALRKSIAIDRKDRYQTVDEFLNDFLPERNKISTAVKISLSLLVIALFLSGGLYYKQQQDIQLKEQALLAEQEVVNAQRLAAEKQVEISRIKNKNLENTKLDIEQGFDKYEQDAIRLKKRLDEHAFVSSAADSLEWQLSVTRDISSLESIYVNNEWISVVSLKHPEEYIKPIISKALDDFEVSKQATEIWLNGYHKKVSNVYLAKARDEIYVEDYPSAKKLIALARQYYSGNNEITPVQALLAKNWKAKKGQDKELLRQENYKSYEIYNESAARHVSSCTEQLSTTGSGFSYDMKVLQRKLTLLNKKYRSLRSEVSTANKSHVKSLGQCIRLYGETDPKEAVVVLAKARKLFPSYATALSNITIRPFDSCNPNFAGKGRRYTCSDRLINNSGSTGPELVVIRSKSSGIFAIGKYEVTQGQMAIYCRQKQCDIPKEKDFMLPAVGYSLGRISSYIAWLNKETGFSYRLPSHSEWDYSARGRGGVLDNDRNCQLNSRGLVKGVRLLPVDIGKENSWGLVNHIGNAQEIVKDGSRYRVAGGSKLTPMENCGLEELSQYRSEDGAVTGFRVIRKIVLK